MNTRTTLFLVAAPALLFQVESLPPPKHPEQPFRILVFSEPRGEAAVVARVLEAEKECQKILKRKKDWFVTADRQHAEVVMEIKNSRMDEELTTERDPMRPGAQTGFTITREHHYLFAEVTILGSQFELKADDQRLKGAASKLMNALEEFCRKNYWEILQRR
jgi:hypothetical protein